METYSTLFSEKNLSFILGAISDRKTGELPLSSASTCPHSSAILADMDDNPS
jgi:hypothetical protein